MKTIAIIGCGSLGGFLAEAISDLCDIHSILLIDYDIVESKNLKNSIYEQQDVGRFKVETLKEIIDLQKTGVIIDIMQTKYIEGETQIPKCDLVIDCRDFVYNRGTEIDTRMYISSRYLIIDCRKDINYAKNHHGKYIENLTTIDLKMASTSAAVLIQKGLLPDIIKHRMVHKIELDYLNRDVSNALNLRLMKPDEVFDCHKDENKLINLDENIQPIINLNKECELKVCLGDRHKPMITKTIPIGKLCNPHDVIKTLIETIDIPYTYNSYLILVGKETNLVYIELLAETGAA